MSSLFICLIESQQLSVLVLSFMFFKMYRFTFWTERKSALLLNRFMGTFGAKFSDGLVSMEVTLVVEVHRDFEI